MWINGSSGAAPLATCGRVHRDRRVLHQFCLPLHIKNEKRLSQAMNLGCQKELDPLALEYLINECSSG